MIPDLPLQEEAWDKKAQRRDSQEQHRGIKASSGYEYTSQENQCQQRTDPEVNRYVACVPITRLDQPCVSPRNLGGRRGQSFAQRVQGMLKPVAHGRFLRRIRALPT